MRKEMYVVTGTSNKYNSYEVLGYVTVITYPKLKVFEVSNFKHEIVGTRVPTSVDVSVETLTEILKDFWNSPDVLYMGEVEE